MGTPPPQDVNRLKRAVIIDSYITSSNLQTEHNVTENLQMKSTTMTDIHSRVHSIILKTEMFVLFIF